MTEDREQALESVNDMTDREFTTFFYDAVERRSKPESSQKFGLIWLTYENDEWLFDTIAKPIGTYSGNASKAGFYVWMCSECNFHVVSFLAAGRCPVCDHELETLENEPTDDQEQVLASVSRMTDREFATFFYDVLERRAKPDNREKFGLIWLNFADDDVWEYDTMAKPIDADFSDARQDRLSAWRCPGCRFPVISFSPEARCPVCEHELKSNDE